jgi:histidyl-tRNA synthetase
VPAVGFALGLERLLGLLAAGGVELPGKDPHIYLVMDGEQGIARGMVFAEELRAVLPGLRLQVNCGGGSFKSQFKRADRSGAVFALVIGDSEAAQQQVVLKPLRSDADQESLLQQDIAGIIAARLQLPIAT